MEDIYYFKEKIKSIRGYRKIVLLISLIKNDVDILEESSLSIDCFQKLYNECKQTVDNE